MAEAQPLCIYEKRDPHIAIIRLNRPEKKNAISRDLYWALDEAWHKAKDDDDVWSIILTGTADAFCVGGDLKENLAFAKGEMTGPALRAATVLQHAHRCRCTNRSSRRSTVTQWAAVLVCRWPAIFATACRHRSSVAPKCAGRTWPPGRITSARSPPVGVTGLLSPAR